MAACGAGKCFNVGGGKVKGDTGGAGGERGFIMGVMLRDGNNDGGDVSPPGIGLEIGFIKWDGNEGLGTGCSGGSKNVPKSVERLGTCAGAVIAGLIGAFGGGASGGGNFVGSGDELIIPVNAVIS